MLVCIYEDRLLQIPGLKLLLISLSRYCAGWPIHLRFPNVPESFKEWLKPMTHVRLSEEAALLGNSYNVKPEILLAGLRSGAEPCLWLDTDVLVNGSLDFLDAIPPEEIVATQDPWEYANGSTHRASTWGLIPGRSFPGPINSCVIRVSQSHRGLLEDWSKLTQRVDYLEGQTRPPEKRNRHMLSDQDALSALIASDRYSSVPVTLLRHGRQILQHHGAGAYGLKERMTVLRKGLPPLLHAMGSVKPWCIQSHPSLLHHPRGYYERTYLELSPYVHIARQYRSSLGDSDTSWLDVETLSGKLGCFLSANSPALRGGLQAMAHRFLWRTSHLCKKLSFNRPPASTTTGEELQQEK